MAIAVSISPGAGFSISTGVVEYEAATPPALSDVLIGLIPSNPVAALANGQMLQIIVFAILLGVAITMAGERATKVAGFFQDLNEVVMQMVWIVVRLAPVGVFCLIARTFATEGIDAFLPLLKYFSCVVAALAVHAVITYSC